MNEVHVWSPSLWIVSVLYRSCSYFSFQWLLHVHTYKHCTQSNMTSLIFILSVYCFLIINKQNKIIILSHVCCIKNYSTERKKVSLHHCFSLEAGPEPVSLMPTITALMRLQALGCCTSQVWIQLLIHWRQSCRCRQEHTFILCAHIHY